MAPAAKRRKANLHSYAHTAKRRQPSLGVGLYAPIATLAKRHSTRYFSPSRGLLNRPSQIDVWIAVRSVWRRARTLRQARRYRHIAEALICLASLRRPSSSASVGAPRVLAGLITRYVWFSSRNSVKCTVKAGVLTSELGNRNSPIHLGLSPQ